MGMLFVETPMIDPVGSQVSYISGVLYERLGTGQVLVIRYVETEVQGVLSREIVSKSATSVEALIANIDRAQVFLRSLLPMALQRH